MNAPADKIWASLHNELTPDEKEQFEQVLKDDPLLCEMLKKRRASHEALTELGPDILSNEQLEERILAEWSADHPEYAEKPPPPPPAKGSILSPRKNPCSAKLGSNLWAKNRLFFRPTGERQKPTARLHCG